MLGWKPPQAPSEPAPTHWHVVVYYAFGKPRTIKARSRNAAEREAQIEYADPLRTIEVQGCSATCLGPEPKLRCVHEPACVYP